MNNTHMGAHHSLSELTQTSRRPIASPSPGPGQGNLPRSAAPDCSCSLHQAQPPALVGMLLRIPLKGTAVPVTARSADCLLQKSRTQTPYNSVCQLAIREDPKRHARTSGCQLAHVGIHKRHACAALLPALEQRGVVPPLALGSARTVLMEDGVPMLYGEEPVAAHHSGAASATQPGLSTSPCSGTLSSFTNTVPSCYITALCYGRNQPPHNLSSHTICALPTMFNSALAGDSGPHR